jgi:hypothetical protein
MRHLPGGSGPPKGHPHHKYDREYKAKVQKIIDKNRKANKRVLFETSMLPQYDPEGFLASGHSSETADPDTWVSYDMAKHKYEFPGLRRTKGLKKKAQAKKTYNYVPKNWAKKIRRVEVKRTQSVLEGLLRK